MTTTTSKKPQHNHLIVRANISHAPQSDEIEYVEEWMKGFVSSQGMKTEAGPIVSYILDEGNRGMTAACLINTSHLAFHVWDEVDPPLLQFDFYTCGELKVGEVLKHIDRGFGLLKSKHENMVLDRSEKITVKRQFLKNTDRPYWS